MGTALGRPRPVSRLANRLANRLPNRLGRLQKVATLVPLALLSAAASVAVAGAGSAGPPAGAGADGTLPDGSTVPAQAIEAPASVSNRGQLAPGITGDLGAAVGNAATNGIPSVALTAYQRAETVINSADTSCHLPWQLIAAIGRVESDHGRVGGSLLDDDGVARPAIYGIPLDGSRGTAVITDTDAGLLDGDSDYDRAVGPMQFIPSTWSVVGVDADADSQRDPQDIHDAALATAVYLCSGSDDLATDEGRRASVFRYNHSEQYVDLVLAFYAAYVSGVFTEVPNDVAGYVPPVGVPGPGGGGGGGGGNPTGGPKPTDGPTGGAGPTSGPTPTGQPTPTQQPTSNPTKLPTKTPTAGLPTSLPTLPTILPTNLPTTLLTPLLSLAEALLECTSRGLLDNPLNNDDAFDRCVDTLTGR
jgi:membrane-bound lytic murein transglycosylase B